MRKLWLLALVGFVGFVAAHAQNPDTRTLTILHTNDTHAHTLPNEKGIGGYGAISTYIKGVKSQQEDVLVLDGGDQITGSPVSSLFEGVPVFEIMNTIPYDCAVLGNHEFDHGWDRIETFQKVAKFPLLCANIQQPDGVLVGDGPTRFFTVNAIRIGIIGVLSKDLYRLTVVKGHEGLIVKNPAETVRALLPAVSEKSDLVIVLSHCGVEEDKRIASSVEGIDVIVGGHSSTRLESPLVVNETIIVQAGGYTDCVGRLDLVIDTSAGKVLQHKGQLIAMENKQFPSDPQTQQVVEEWEKEVSALVDVEIGHNPVEINRSKLTEIISRIMKDYFKVDWGYHNPGGTRAELPKGKILKRHIWNILPFSNTTMVLKIDGKSASQFFTDQSHWEEDREYTIATNSYIGDKVVEECNLPQKKVIRHDILLRGIIIEYIQKHGQLK